MELTKALKEKVEKAQTREEAKKLIEEAGLILNDAELDQVAGGEAEEHRNRRKPTRK